MKKGLMHYLCCNECKSDLILEINEINDEEIISGQIKCKKCLKKYDIVRGIPRFVDSENYTDSFGFQWNKYSKTQLDSFNGTQIFKNRFINITKWELDSLKNKLILDAGCGPGAFVDVVSKYDAEIIAFDLSNAIEACYKNHGTKRNVHVIQADIYKLPFKESIFDYIYCIGVIQHTPDPKKAIMSLPRHLKNGGKIAFWIYSKLIFGLPKLKHVFRLFTSKLTIANGENFIDWYVPKAIKMRRRIKKTPFIGKYIQKLFPVADYQDKYPLNKDQLREWAFMDTYDMLITRYEYPMFFSTIRKCLNQCKLNNIKKNIYEAHAVTAEKLS